jgi:hypothetical protein
MLQKETQVLKEREAMWRQQQEQRLQQERQSMQSQQVPNPNPKLFQLFIQLRGSHSFLALTEGVGAWRWWD